MGILVVSHPGFHTVQVCKPNNPKGVIYARLISLIITRWALFMALCWNLPTLVFLKYSRSNHAESSVFNQPRIDHPLWIVFVYRFHLYNTYINTPTHTHTHTRTQTYIYIVGLLFCSVMKDVIVENQKQN